MAEGKTLNDLFLATLRDIFFAEKQILKALPKMARSAQSTALSDAFQTHRQQTELHVERLDRVFELIEKRAQGKTCEAILGIIDEGKEVMEDFAESDALDAGLISAAQAVEHYEIARYGTLKAWAEQLGISEAADLLSQTLKEEVETDALLSELAMRGANKDAGQGSSGKRQGRSSRG